MTYVLPDLPYDYNALAPAIAPEIMELHHDKHHAAYVNGANAALEQLVEAREKNDFANLNKLEKDLAFHLGGHLNHTIFWPNMSPNGGGTPTGDAATTIDEFFGSFAAFKAQFNANANAIQGSGWSMLVWDALGKRLNIMQVFDHQANLPGAQIPLLLLDMWEHAFYLQYKNVKGDYVNAWWDVVNWDDVNQRLAAAKGTSGLV